MWRHPPGKGGACLRCAPVGPSPSGSPVDPREQRLEEWTWRLGQRAARLRLRGDRWNLVVLVPFQLALATLLVVEDLAYHTRLLPAALALYALSGVMVAGFLVSRVRTGRAVSRALGVPVGLFEPTPPAHSEGYEQWCRARGVTPYPFRPPPGEPQRHTEAV